MTTTQHRPSDVDDKAMRVFMKSLELAGGVGDLVKSGAHSYLPALLESSYVMVLKNEKHQPNEEIADYLGISTGAVSDILEAPTEGALIRLTHPSMEEDSPPDFGTVAGGLAKSAYQVIRREEQQRAN